MPSAAPDIEFLKQHDTPTIWNALVGLRGRGTAGMTRGRPVVTHPHAAPMVGYAMTARLVSCAPADQSAEAQLTLRHAYYRYLGSGPRPGIVVIEDCGDEPGVGSFWGEVNSAIHRGFGLSGVITTGAVRDLDALDPALPILAGTVCLGNGFAHLTEIDVPVEVFGLQIKPGDLLHADRHGAMIVPSEHIEALPAAITALRDRERQVIARTREPGFDAEAMIRAWQLMGSKH
jgi:regulator of RNase E activity RraA